MNARIPSKASAPVSALSGSRDPTATSGSTLPPRGRSTLVRAPTVRSNRSSPTISIGVLHPSAPRTTRRSFIQLHDLGLHGMAKAFVDIEAGGEAASLGHAEWLALLLEREASLRRDKRLSKRLQYAKLRQQ